MERFPNLDVESARPLADPSEAYDSRRNQYHSTRILVLLEHHVESLVADRVLGVTTYDLFVPGMNFVFGEARCPGRVGVVSTFRLRNVTSPDRAGEPLLLRLRKEAVHEVGHMYGLKHCSNRLCVMHFSKSLADTDVKSDMCCLGCRSEFEMLKDE